MNSPERYYFRGDGTKSVKRSVKLFKVSYLSHSGEVIKKNCICYTKCLVPRETVSFVFPRVEVIYANTQ